ncbi:MAG: response regulator [Deltaproteobacteria bacterium]|nr:response regulator [Deltaproteobacteria bacterium]
MSERRILVVEDSPTMRQLIVFALSRVPNIRCVEAEDGVEGLKRIHSETFDLVVTDINMPLMDGLKLLSRIRSDDRHAEVPVIVVTTEAGAEDRARAMSLGANAYIIKPIRAQQVVETVRTLLG